jgi:glucose/arabinose dehydrogenase
VPAHSNQSNGTLYVANPDALVAFPYMNGRTRITVPAQKIVDLPAGDLNHHWTKDVIASPDGRKLYVAVGSNSNVGEKGYGGGDEPSRGSRG